MAEISANPKASEILRFLIFAPEYNENVGGHISLHRLCHEINQTSTASAVLTPYFPTVEIHHRDLVRPLGRLAKSRFKAGFRYQLNPNLNTPVLRRPGMGRALDGYVVIYPEVVEGNPLKARDVVRWLLYHPGSITGKVHYAPGELYVPFSNAARTVVIPGSATSRENLKIVQYPLDIYHPPPVGSQRSGVAYAVRKGRGMALVEHPHDAIRIDGLNHQEIADIFRRVETFISYDPYTAYSRFAAVSGCDSVVIPEPGIDEETWYPDPVDRLGIAYGWTRLQHARATRGLARQRMLDEEAGNISDVQRFIANVSRFFNSADS